MIKKLKGGSLLFVIGMAALLALLVAAVVLLLLYSKNQGNQRIIEDRMQRNLQSAITYSLLTDNVQTKDTLLLDLYKEGSDSVKLIKKNFGIYHYIIAEAYDQARRFSKMALLGNTLMEDEKFALYLVNNHRPVSVSGKTKITGNAYLPEAGVRKAYIEGQAYQGGENAVDGKVIPSETKLAPLDSTILQNLAFFFHKDADSLMMEDNEYEKGFLQDSLSNSFHNKTMIVSLDDSLITQKLQGNIIVHSKRPILIKREAQLEDILIFAPSITIEEGFHGQVQLFASDSLIIEKKVVLDYPSTIGLLSQKDSIEVKDFQPSIHIHEGSKISGTVFSSYEGSDFLSALIRIDKEAVINGQVYADGLLQLQGTVNGITQCKQFSLKTQSTLYENFVLNGEMNFPALSPFYIGSPLLNKGKLLSVIKWLK